jgi:hypothetical protein
MQPVLAAGEKLVVVGPQIQTCCAEVYGDRVEGLEVSPK